MDVEVTPALLLEAPLVADLVHQYLGEFAKRQGRTSDADGRFRYPNLDQYWEEVGRHPFLIRVDSHLAGFALVAQRRLIEAGQPGYAVAEFFVLDAYRRKGVGRDAACAIFDRFPGPWWVAEAEWNAPAHAFWRSVIAQYTEEQYEEERVSWGSERAVVQTFVANPSV